MFRTNQSPVEADFSLVYNLLIIMFYSNIVLTGSMVPLDSLVPA